MAKAVPAACGRIRGSDRIGEEDRTPAWPRLRRGRGLPARVAGRAVESPPGTCSVGVISMWPMFIDDGRRDREGDGVGDVGGLRQLEARR